MEKAAKLADVCSFFLCQFLFSFSSSKTTTWHSAKVLPGRGQKRGVNFLSTRLQSVEKNAFKAPMGGDPFKDLIDFIEFMLVSRNLFQIQSM